jgi:hypothetical protein
VELRRSELAIVSADAAGVREELATSKGHVHRWPGRFVLTGSTHPSPLLLRLRPHVVAPFSLSAPICLF